MRLAGKTAVVTGAGAGIGKSIALEFAKQGAAVFVVNLDRDNGLNTVDEILQSGGTAWFVHADIAKAGEVKRVFAEVQRLAGMLDILVNNAGITGRSYGDGPIGDCSEEAWDKIMGVNLRGTFLCCKYGIQLMVSESQKGGIIINMSSVLGLVGCQDHFTSHAYQTSKAGIIGMTRSIAAYYAKFGIRANVLAPGLIDTLATQKLKENRDILDFTSRMQPLGALGAPSDVAYAAVYLASNESAFVTGQVLAVDGGWTMQ